MGKTYNQRHDIRENRPKYDFPNGFHTDFYGDLDSNKEYDHDYSYSTSDGKFGSEEITRMNCRHPNKKRHRKLLKEFKQTGVDYVGMTILGFDHRFGDINDRRKRKDCERIGNSKRRFKLKQQANKLIKEGINEFNK